MRNSDLERFRIQKLTEAIDTLFGKLDIEEIEVAEETRPHKFLTDMFEVTAVIGRDIELRHLFDDRVFCPVTLPSQIIGLVDCGDVFLMTISKRKNGWKTAFMSRTYESEPWYCPDCEREKELNSRNTNNNSQLELSATEKTNLN